MVPTWEDTDFNMLFNTPTDDYAFFSDCWADLTALLPNDYPLDNNKPKSTQTEQIKPTTPTISSTPKPIPTIHQSKLEKSKYSFSSLSSNATRCGQPTITHFKVPRISSSSVRFPMMLHTEGRAYELLQEQFQPNPTPEQLNSVDKQNLYLRWVEEPPERVHATSPTRLVGSKNPRPGAPFCYSVQLVAYSQQFGVYVPYPAPEKMVISAHMYGKRKTKTGKPDTTGYNDFVKLITNPVGKPLMVRNDSGIIDTILEKGQTIAVFDQVSLTCGSNAARAKSAPSEAKGWDWDYHILIKSVHDSLSIYSLMSKHITTDSNRSQTREKRKRSDMGIQIYCEHDSHSPKKFKSESESSPESSPSTDESIEESLLPSPVNDVSLLDPWMIPHPFENHGGLIEI